MTPGKIAVQAVTSDECKLTKFSVRLRFVAHPSALQPNEGLEPQPKLVLIYQQQKEERLIWPA